MKQQPVFKSFRLSPVDHTLPKVYIFKTLYFRPVDNINSLARLRDGIDRLISCLAFLSGEVVPCADLPDKIGVLQVQMPGLSLQDIPMLLVKSFPNNAWTGGSNNYPSLYHPLPGFIPPSKPRPVVRFQANLLAEGLVLCMGYNHAVFDGTGAGYILEMLADCCRAEPASIVSLPTTSEVESKLRVMLSDAAVALADDFQVEIPSHCVHTDIDPEPFPAMLCNQSFLLSSERIDCMRDACNGLLPHLVQTYRCLHELVVHPDMNWPKFLSSNDVLTALLAVSVEKARTAAGAQGQRSNSLAMAVEFRGRLKGMPAHYLGNLVTTVWATHNRPSENNPDTMAPTTPTFNLPGIDQDDLLWIAHVAFRVRLGLNAISDEYIRGLVHYLYSQDDWGQIGIPFTDPIFISSWRHLKVYELDFGLDIGQVENFEMDVGNSDGVCIVMPAHHKRAGGMTKKAPWDIRFILNPEVIEPLINNSLLLWAVAKGVSSR
ncbi:O-acetyltransferase [Penicillium concentricum]|uniref:O-acetyltransferase n=1 Tax=Penicillium concentricum TaxID=293559 RepID=A0A9W9S9W1_9EURO|nr:O-acetyltransferase [Penicillium concentricum]KAJ5374688.1 O-acetyltransferase [Penicillium concentricum]